MFSTATQSVQGVSAVKALTLASQQGQRIYHITPQNQNQTLSNLHLGSLAMKEIQQGLATGKEIIAHTDPINVSGWVGEGYLILDPDTGSGAYKISGGLNGGWLFVGLGAIGVMMWLSIAPLLAATTFSVALFAVAMIGWYLLFVQAIQFAQGLRDIDLSNCPADVRQRLSSALTSVHVLEALSGALFAAYAATLTGIRHVLTEALQLLSVDAGFSLFQEIATNSTDNQINQCR